MKAIILFSMFSETPYPANRNIINEGFKRLEQHCPFIWSRYLFETTTVTFVWETYTPQKWTLLSLAYITELEHVFHLDE